MSARNRYKRIRRLRRQAVAMFSGPEADLRFREGLAELMNRIDAEPMGTGADDMRDDGYVYDYRLPLFGGWVKRREDVKP